MFQVECAEGYLYAYILKIETHISQDNGRWKVYNPEFGGSFCTYILFYVTQKNPYLILILFFDEKKKKRQVMTSNEVGLLNLNFDFYCQNTFRNSLIFFENVLKINWKYCWNCDIVSIVYQLNLRICFRNTCLEIGY